MPREDVPSRHSSVLVGSASAALVLLVLPAVAFAQSGGVSWGVKAGATVSMPLTSVVSGATDRRTDFTAGAFLTVPVRRPVAIQPEIFYVAKGRAYRTGGVTQALKITYLAVPVLARLSFSGAVSPYVVAGPQIAFRVNAAASLEAPGVSIPATMFPATTFTAIDLTGGAGIEVHRLVIEGRYAHGLTDTIGPVPSIPGGARVEQKYRVVWLLAGVRF